MNEDPIRDMLHEKLPEKLLDEHGKEIKFEDEDAR